MALDVTVLEFAEVRGDSGYNLWTAEANGCKVSLVTSDLEALFYVSPIWNMRQQGVSLVDSSGQMVANERRDR